MLTFSDLALLRRESHIISQLIAFLYLWLVCPSIRRSFTVFQLTSCLEVFLKMNVVLVEACWLVDVLECDLYVCWIKEPVLGHEMDFPADEYEKFAMAVVLLATIGECFPWLPCCFFLVFFLELLEPHGLVWLGRRSCRKVFL